MREILLPFVLVGGLCGIILSVIIPFSYAYDFILALPNDGLLIWVKTAAILGLTLLGCLIMGIPSFKLFDWVSKHDSL